MPRFILRSIGDITLVPDSVVLPFLREPGQKTPPTTPFGLSGTNPTGITLDKEEMAFYEKKLVRYIGLEKWFVDIPADC